MYHVQLPGIYIITHRPTGHFYIGKSVNIFSRFSSHLTDISLGKHSSNRFADLWNSSDPSEWRFEILEYVDREVFYQSDQVLDTQDTEPSLSAEYLFNRWLLYREKYWMSVYPKSKALNQNRQYFLQDGE